MTTYTEEIKELVCAYNDANDTEFYSYEERMAMTVKAKEGMKRVADSYGKTYTEVLSDVRMASMEKTIDGLGHRALIEVNPITETVRDIFIPYDYEDVLGYEFKAYCAKCGMNKGNTYRSRREAVEALYNMAKWERCGYSVKAS